MTTKGLGSVALAPLSEAQQHRVHMPTDRWSDEFALKVSNFDFDQAQIDRHRNHDWRWAAADELYLAWVKKKYWEGTRIPRSNLGVFTSFEQIESMLPQILHSIFTVPEWFEADPRAGTHPAQARASKWLITQQLENERNNVREVFRRGIKSGLVYGNGITEAGWRRSSTVKPWPQMVDQEITVPVSMPYYGNFTVKTGRTRRIMEWGEKTEEINEPFIRNVPIHDFYIDKNCPGPVVQEARFAIKRALVPLDFLERRRGEPGFKIPEQTYLHELAQKKPVRQADVSKQATDYYRDRWWEPHTDPTIDPAGKRIEILFYWTKEREIWNLNGEHIAYNEPNRYQMIPFFNWFYTDVLSRFYGIAVTDVVEHEQRLQQGIINGRIDELALSLHPQTVKKRGKSVPAYALRRRPGGVVEAENPKDDVIREIPQNITQSAYIEVQASDLRVQKATGGTDLALLGTPAAGGNSANRTATGVEAQRSATASRIHYLTSNGENLVIVPILNFFHNANTRWLKPEQPIQILGPETGRMIQIDPMLVMTSEVKFSMRAAARARARGTLVQLLPQIAPVILNPELLDLLARQQQVTLDVQELFNMILDATVYSNRKSLFRPLTQQEQQASQQPPPKEMAKLEAQRMRAESAERMAETRSETDILKEIVKMGGQEIAASARVQPGGTGASS